MTVKKARSRELRLKELELLIIGGILADGKTVYWANNYRIPLKFPAPISLEQKQLLSMVIIFF